MRVVPERRASRRLPQGRVIGLTHPEFATPGVLQINASTASAAWSAANKPFAIEFAVNYACVVRQLGWINGTAAGGGVDMGIYDLAWNRLVSTGAQTGTGNSVFQWIDVTDTALAPGRYYLAMSRDNTTANRILQWATLASADLMKVLGCFDSATDAYPLPNPLTNMVAAATFTRPPSFWIATRTPFA